jgi:hypothetical protein
MESHISGTDFPFKPWHTYYDWNYKVQPGPQYRNLLSTCSSTGRHLSSANGAGKGLASLLVGRASG